MDITVVTACEAKTVTPLAKDVLRTRRAGHRPTFSQQEEGGLYKGEWKNQNPGQQVSQDSGPHTLIRPSCDRQGFGLQFYAPVTLSKKMTGWLLFLERKHKWRLILKEYSEMAPSCFWTWSLTHAITKLPSPRKSTANSRDRVNTNQFS